MRIRSLVAADLAVLSVGLVAALSLSPGSPTAGAPVLQGEAAVAVSPLPSVAAPVVPAPAPGTTAPTAAPAPAPAPTTTSPAPVRPAATTPAATHRVPHAGSRAAALRDLTLYRGLGTWVDAYDFAPEFGGRLTPATVDRMAQAGIETIYLQAAKEDRRSPGLLVRPDLVRQWVARAHAHGIRVQAWYLPKLLDPARDRAHLQALMDFRVADRGFDSIGLDIEARNVDDLSTRNTRLVALSRWLRAATDLPLSGIVLAPVHTDIVNTAFWPHFPWAALRGSFDVWQTMGYWTDRKKSSPYKDAYRQTVTNVQLLRGHLGDVPVHPIGGIGVQSLPQLQGYIRALHDSDSLGGSLYDWVTTPYNAYGWLARVPQ